MWIRTAGRFEQRRVLRDSRKVWATAPTGRSSTTAASRRLHRTGDTAVRRPVAVCAACRQDEPASDVGSSGSSTKRLPSLPRIELVGHLRRRRSRYDGVSGERLTYGADFVLAGCNRVVGRRPVHRPPLADPQPSWSVPLKSAPISSKPFYLRCYQTERNRQN